MTDAHNHLQDALFDPIQTDVIATMQSAGVTRCVVNGTRPNDWPKVAELAAAYPTFIIPSFGLHPWFVSEMQETDNWLGKLTHHLDSTPSAGIGECGLDRSIQTFNIERQCQVFKAHLTLAAERNLPLSIHCVRAWGMMLEILRNARLPNRGFLLHSYGGAAELIPELTELGAYFSFSGSILHPHQKKQRLAFQAIPPDRLLIETDAPNQRPPANAIAYPLNEKINHPANLPTMLQAAAAFLDTSKIDNNATQFFDSGNGL